MTISQEDYNNAINLPDHDYQWEINTPYRFNDLIIVIEYLSQDVRTKVTKSGIPITNTMPAAYGYILRTTDRVGEELDMYLASYPDRNAKVYVIDQVDPANGTFDEHKVMLGFGSPEEAYETYIMAFSDNSGARRVGAITIFSIDSFMQWLSEDGTTLSPASSYNNPDTVVNKNFDIKIDKNKYSHIDETGGVSISLPDISKGPRLNVLSNESGGYDYTLYMYSALDTKEWSNAIDVLCRTLSNAKDTDVFHINIISPGGSVILAGRIISGMCSTKAKVITYAQGLVGSAATTIWAYGHERHIAPNAYFMQHMSSQMLSGNTASIVEKSIFCMNYISKQLEYLVEINLFTVEEIESMKQCTEDVFISNKQAIERMGEISYCGERS